MRQGSGRFFKISLKNGRVNDTGITVLNKFYDDYVKNPIKDVDGIEKTILDRIENAGGDRDDFQIERVSRISGKTEKLKQLSVAEKYGLVQITPQMEATIA